MKVISRIVVFTIICNSITSAYSQNIKIPVSNPEIMFNAFAQGGDAGTGNCAAIALCKAAILTFGINGVFEHSYSNGIYQIQLKSGKKVTLTDAELNMAKSVAGFESRKFAGYTPNDTIEKDKVREYAYLCYAVMAKMVMAHGDGNLQHDDPEDGFKDSCFYSSLRNALIDLNDGGITPTNYHLLGLDEYVRAKRRWSSTRDIPSGLCWSGKHAMFIRKKYCDRYGSKKRLIIYPVHTGRIEIVSQKQTDFKHRRTFASCP